MPPNEFRTLKERAGREEQRRKGKTGRQGNVGLEGNRKPLREAVLKRR